MSMWDERYSANDTVYGVQPNVFFASQLAMRELGTVCLPCDGEGRNAVHAAAKGWTVRSFDVSPVGVQKAQALAASRGVDIQVEVADALVYAPEAQFDVVGLVFAHMPEERRAAFHARVWQWVKPGGCMIVEGFHRDQLRLNSGGPKRLDMLFHEATFAEDIERAFDDATLVWNARCAQVLDEGPFHQGPAVTCQVVIQKK